MTLVELEAQFYRIETPTLWKHVETLAESRGIQFLCPKCFLRFGGRAGCHMVCCWWVGVPPDVLPGPGRWNPAGTGYADLTFVGPGATSVLLKEGCGAHFHVEGGAIVGLS